MVCFCGVFFCHSNSLSCHLCVLGAITGSTTGVEPYSSASSAPPLPLQNFPTFYNCSRTHTITFDGPCECVCPPAPLRGSDVSVAGKMADSGSASLCPPEVLASAIMSALQAGNRLRHHARPPQQLVHIVSDCHSLLPPLTGATCFS